MGLQKSCPHRPEKHLSLILLCMSLVWNTTHYNFAYNNTSLPADDS